MLHIHHPNPVTPGAGVVLETGSAVSHVAPGDKVLLSFTHCETCPPCTSGHPAYCHSFNPRNMNGRRPDGSAAMYTTSHTSTNEKTPVFSSFFGQSSFARHTLAHRSCVVRIPADADLALYAPLGCGMQTGAGAVLNSLGVRAGSSVAVFGAGSVGMAAIMAAAHVARAAVVIAVDVQPERLELAKKLGATHTVLASREEGSGGKSSVVERIRELCPPVGVDFAVDCTGVPSVIRDMVDCLGTKGRASTVGAPGFGKEVGIDVMQHLTYGKEYVGCCEGDSLPSKVSCRKPSTLGNDAGGADHRAVYPFPHGLARQRAVPHGGVHSVLRLQGLRQSH
jgi:Zn-dependent alcohol dehydrogenase